MSQQLIYAKNIDANAQWGFHRAAAAAPEDIDAITGGNLSYAVPPIGTGLCEVIQEHKTWTVTANGSGEWKIQLTPYLDAPVVVWAGAVGPAIAPGDGLDVLDAPRKANIKAYMQIGICARFTPTEDQLERSGSIAAIGQFVGQASGVTFDTIGDSDGGTVVPANTGCHLVRSHMPLSFSMPVVSFNPAATSVHNYPVKYSFDPHEFRAYQYFGAVDSWDTGAGNFTVQRDVSGFGIVDVNYLTSELCNSAVMYGQGMTPSAAVGKLTVTAVYAYMNQGTGNSTRPIEVYRPAASLGPPVRAQTAQVVAATAARVGDLFNQENMAKLRNFASKAMSAVGMATNVAGYFGVPGAGAVSDAIGMASSFF